MADPTSDILTSIDRMMYHLAKRAMPRGTAQDELDEVVQQVRIHLWTKSLPQFDPSRGVKLSTFLHRCVANRISDIATADRRQRRSRPMRLRDSVDRCDTSQDHLIEALAERVIADPASYGFSANDIVVFNSMLSGSDIPSQELSARLGYSRPSSYSSAKRRVRQRIASLI